MDFDCALRISVMEIRQGPFQNAEELAERQDLLKLFPDHIHRCTRPEGGIMLFQYTERLHLCVANAWPCPCNKAAPVTGSCVIAGCCVRLGRNLRANCARSVSVPVNAATNHS